MCGSMVDIQSAAAEIRRGIKKDRKKLQGKNIMSASATQGGHNYGYGNGQADEIQRVITPLAREPYKMAEPIEVPFRMWTRMGPRNYVGLLDGYPDPLQEGTLLRSMESGFTCKLPSTVPKSLDVCISQHAVDQRFVSLAAEAVQCYIKFSK